MLHHLISPRALVALVALATSLSCASSGPPNDTSVAAPQFSDESGKNDGRSLEDLFAGRFPGVSVQRAEGGGLHILVRGGSNTFYGSNEPLFVVDDVSLASGHGGIVFLNPNDIGNIEVLKNPADIGIYGMRGGNGVIRITTRKPGR